MGKMQRTKGSTGEREVAKIFNNHGFTAKRGGFMQAQDPTRCGDAIIDELPNYWVEVKRGAQTRPIEALLQAKKAAAPGMECVAFTRRDRCEWEVWLYADINGIDGSCIVCMNVDQFFKAVAIQLQKQEKKI